MFGLYKLRMNNPDTIFTLTLRAFICVVLCFITTDLLATNGYFRTAYSAVNRGMGGAGIASSFDGMTAATNPAAMSLSPSELNIGIDFFNPVRKASLDCTGIGSCTTTVRDKSDNDLFLILNIGYIKHLNHQISLGIALYGNGGMNTEYKRNVYDENAARIFDVGTSTGTPNTGKLGVDLSQLLIAPSISYRLKDHYLGASVILATQRFKAEGLGNSALISSDPTSLTNRGYDWSLGAGWRLGWLYQLNQKFRLAMSYTSVIAMSEFEKYSGLFSENGDFDIPAHFTMGLLYQPTQKTTLLFDLQRIFYNNVDSLGNPPITAQEEAGVISPDRLLGASNGMGFGWENIWVAKAGLNYRYNEKTNFRLGFSYNEAPFRKAFAFQNLIAPATNKYHATAGISYALDSKNTLHVAYVHAFHNSVSHSTSLALQSSAKLSMHQNSLIISFSHDFD